MPKYRKYQITEVVPCYVTFRYTVDAESEQDAENAYGNGEYTYEGCEVGDQISFLDVTDYEIKELADA